MDYTMRKDRREPIQEMSFLPECRNVIALDDLILAMDNLNEAAGISFHDEDAERLQRFPLRLGYSCLLFVSSGRVRFNADFRDIAVKGGMCAVIPVGTILERVDTDPGTRLVFLWFSPDGLPSSSPDRQGDASPLNALRISTPVLQPVHEDMFKRVYGMLRTMMADPAFEVNRSRCVFHCLNLLDGILAQGTPCGSQRPARASRRDEIVARFLQGVQGNYRQHRDLGFYADLLGLSLKYMSHVIFEQTGRHPSQWIKDYVILDAKTMLRSRRYTVQQVAEELNFPNQSFFGKYFKEAVGVSPKKWVRQEDGGVS